MSFQAVKIKKQAGSQLIRIPDQMKIEDDKVYLKKIGNSIYVIPYHNPWDSLVDSTKDFTDDFMSERNQPEQQERERLE